MKTPHEVLAAFGEMTGIVFRVVPDSVLRQAAEFAKSFTLEELDTVVEYTRAQAKSGAVAFNAQSLAWKKLMGDYGASDAFQVLQERLGLANEAVRRKAWRFTSRYAGNDRRTSPPAAQRPPATRPEAPSISAAQEAALRAQRAEELRKLHASLGIK